MQRRYQTAKVLKFASPTGDWWVRVRVLDDDRSARTGCDWGNAGFGGSGFSGKAGLEFPSYTLYYTSNRSSAPRKSLIGQLLEVKLLFVMRKWRSQSYLPDDEFLTGSRKWRYG